MTLDAEIVTHISDVLKRITEDDRRSFACCPHTERNTAEYLMHFFKSHFDAASAPREFLSPKTRVLKDGDAERYRSIKQQVAEAGNRYCVDDREFWNTQKILDFKDANCNMVILHDYTSTQEIAERLRSNFHSKGEGRCVAEMRFALNHGSGLLTDDRSEYLREIYRRSDALAAEGQQRPIGELDAELKRLYDSEPGAVYTEQDVAQASSTTLLHYLALGTAYSRDEVAKHLSAQPIEDAARVFTALYERDDLFDCLERSHSALDAIMFTNAHNSIDDAWHIYERRFNSVGAFMLTYGGYGKEEAFKYLTSHYSTQEVADIIDVSFPEDERWQATETAYKGRIPIPLREAETSTQDIHAPAYGGGVPANALMQKQD